MNKQVYIDTSSKTPAGLAKTRRMIKTQKDKEIQILKLSAMIKFDEFKKSRAIDQREERRLKRIG